MLRKLRQMVVIACVTYAWILPATADGKQSHEDKLRDAGVKAPAKVLSVSRNNDLRPWRGVAVLHNEVGIPQRNIFGCDHGPSPARPPFCNQAVTHNRVRALKLSSFSNGIGWTQITFKPLVRAYNGKWRKMHRIREQMKVGFRHLETLQRNLGVFWGAARYNGSGPAAEAYARVYVQRAAFWKDRGGW